MVDVVGDRTCKPTHLIRDFLSRQGVAFSWHPPESAIGRGILEDCQKTGDVSYPIVMRNDGTYICNPTLTDLAEFVGIKVRPSKSHYDLAIIGGGPAGLSGAVYAASEGLSVVLLDASVPGGQAGTSSRIENYLGFPDGVSGQELAQHAAKQAVRLNAEIISPIRVDAVYRRDGEFVLSPSERANIRAKAVLLATGVSWRRLNVPGVEDLIGQGIYYGYSMVEADGCSNEDVHVVGGGNSAGQAAVHLAKFARTVVLLVRRDLKYTMSDYLIRQIAETPNIHVSVGTEVRAAMGHGRLQKLMLRREGGAFIVKSHALFIMIGGEPKTDWIKDQVTVDAKGYILTGQDAGPFFPLPRSPYQFESNVPGLFVAGDVRRGSVKRVASAVGEGARAISDVHTYLGGL